MNLSLLLGVPAAVRRRLQVSLLTVGLVAVPAALADSFLAISLQGAVGAVERVGDPFRRWLTISALMVPLYVLGVLAAVALARWWFAGTRWRRLLYCSAVATMIGATSMIGVAEVAGSAAYDYHLQSSRIERTAAQMEALTGAEPGEVSAAGPGTVQLTVCTTCESRRRTLEVHVRGGLLASGLIVATNAVLVVWVVALRGGQLWIDPRRKAPPSPGPAVDPAFAVT